MTKAKPPRYLLNLILSLVLVINTVLPGLTMNSPTHDRLDTNRPTVENGLVREVRISAFGFTPNTLAITSGTTVVWHNDTETAHVLQGEGGILTLYLPIIANQGSGTTGGELALDSGSPAPAGNFSTIILPGQNFSYTYESVGEFGFYLVDQPEFSGNVTVLEAPTATTLLPIGNQTAPLGATLSFIATAVSPTGNPITFSVQPMPLAANMSFDSMSGAFTFTPLANQVGSYTFTLTASDGVTEDSETIRIDVPEPDPGDDTALRGRLLDAELARRGITLPLVGATVTHIESGQTVTTDADGYFLLTNLPPGRNHFDFDGSTANPANTYGAYRADLDLIPNVTNLIERPIFLMAIDPDGLVIIDPDEETVLTNPNIDVTVTIPPYTVKDENGNNYEGELSISPVPAGFTPGSLPDTLNPDQIITVQPMGLTFATPVTVTFPNTNGLAPGSEVDIWSLDHSTGQFFIAGTGQVTPDGQWVETIDGGIRETSWHFPLPFFGPPNNQGDGQNDNGNNGPPCEGGSTVTLDNGCLGTSISLPSYTSLGESRAVDLVYKSDRANPNLVIPFGVTYPANGALPPLVSYYLTVGGVQQADPVYIDATTLDENQDEPVRGTVIFDASDLETGLYPYTIRITGHYDTATVSNTLNGTLMVINDQDNPFGVGWNLADLQNLHVQPDGNILLTEGSGGMKLYQDPFPGFLIEIGDVVMGEISTPGEVDTYSFVAEAGQTVYFDVQNQSGLSPIDWQVIDEVGNIIFNTCLGCTEVGVRTLEQGGIYTLTIGEEDTANTGTYQFQIWNVPPPDVFGISIGDIISDGNPGAGAGNIESPGVRDIYTFSATAGQTVYFDVQGHSSDLSSVNWQAEDEAGTAIFNTCLGCTEAGLRTLELGGTYTITVGENNNDGVGTYQFQIWNVPSPDVFGISIGDIISDGNPGAGAGNIESPGVRDIYTFSATAGQTVYFDVQGHSSDLSSVNWQAEDEAGTVIFNTCLGCTEAGLRTLELGGTYTITVGENNNDGVGTYQFQIWNVPPPDVFGISIGDIISDGNPGAGAGNIESPGVRDIYTFSATAGQAVYFDVQGHSSDLSSVNWQAEDEAGTVIFNTCLGCTEPGLRTLELGGTYTITVGENNNDGIGTYQFQIIDQTIQNVAIQQESQLFEDLTSELPSASSPLDNPENALEDEQVEEITLSTISIIIENELMQTLTYQSPGGDYSFLTLNEDGTFIRRMRDGTEYYFDSNGLQTAMNDRNGNTTTYNYNSSDQLTSITGPSGRVTTFSYVGGYLSSVTDPTGRTTTFLHDVQGNISEVTYPDGSKQTFSYDDRHLMTGETDQNGELTTRQYDDIGHWISATLPDGTVRQASVSRIIGWVDPTSGLGTEDNPAPVVRPEDAFATLTDGEGRTTTFGIGAVQQFSSIMDPAGFVTSITLDVAGNPTQTTNPSGAIFDRTYDSMGNLLTFTDQTLDGTTSFTYEPTYNQVTAITNPFNETTTFDYDPSGNLTTITTPLNRTTAFTHTPQGLVATMTDPLGTLTQYGYNNDYNLTSLIQNPGPDQRTASMTYTAEGYIASLTDPLGRLFSFVYDELGRLMSESLPGGRTISYDYDTVGNLTSLTPPGRTAHTFTYNEIDLLASYTAPAVPNGGTNSTTYDYNFAQQLELVTRPDGLTLYYDYDPAGRLTSLTIPRGIHTYTYSPATGQLATLTDPSGINLAYGYTGELLTDVTWSGTINGTVGYTYDAGARLAELDIAGTPIPFGYDADDALTQAGALSLAYAPTSGLITGTTLNNVTDSWSFNAFAELDSYTAAYNGSDQFAATYTRDDLGRIIEKVETVNGITDTYEYGYDPAGRLATVRQNSTLIATYTYDLNGNRLNDGTNSATYDAQDRLLTYGPHTYTYTPNGELLTKTTGPDTTTYDYDVLGNLISVTLPDGTTISYLIDGEGRRVGRRDNGTLTHGYLYGDALNPVAELDGSGNLVSTFIYASQANVPDYMVKNGITYRIISDHLGSVRLVINSQTGAIAQQLNYDAFGQVTQDTAPGFQPFGYAGGLYDPDTGLVRFGARDYDAEPGRWTAKDPIIFNGDPSNNYLYTTNDPVNFLDIEGLKKKTSKNKSSNNGNTSIDIDIIDIDEVNIDLPDDIDIPSGCVGYCPDSSNDICIGYCPNNQSDWCIGYCPPPDIPIPQDKPAPPPSNSCEEMN